MNILIVNDDGIDSAGIHVLSELALPFGEVYVVAPAAQCSAMSHRITLKEPLIARKREDYPVEGIKEAYSLTGTPADCVKAALEGLIPVRPDVVFSGINDGFNVGTEILYSGTVGAAMEAAAQGIPAIAYSVKMSSGFETVRKAFQEVTEELFERGLPESGIWNVNFPGTDQVEEARGVLFERKPARLEYHYDHYDMKELEDGSIRLDPQYHRLESAPEGTDIEAVLNGYISVGIVDTMA